MSDEHPSPVPLSPSALLESIAARLELLHGGTDGLLVRAVPVKSLGQGKVDGGFVYARPRDPNSGEEIDARPLERLATAPTVTRGRWRPLARPRGWVIRRALGVGRRQSTARVCTGAGLCPVRSRHC